MCSVEKARFSQFQFSPPLEKQDSKGKKLNTDVAIGYSHAMTSSALYQAQEGLFQLVWEVAVPQANIQPALNAVRTLVKDNQLCLPLIGMYLRFSKIEDISLLSFANTGGAFKEGETAMFIEIPVYIPVGFSTEKMEAYLATSHKIVQLLIEEYGGRAHWGKNQDWVFAGQKDLGTYSDKLARFNKVVAALDPLGVFSNSFAKKIGITWPKLGEDFSAFCANNTCKCSVESMPVCERNQEISYTNRCRALCDGTADSELLEGRCEDYVFKTKTSFQRKSLFSARPTRFSNQSF